VQGCAEGGFKLAVEWSPDVGQAAWIAQSVSEYEFVPSGFEAYAQVLHPVEHDRTLELLVRWKDVAAWSGIPLEPHTPFEAISIPEVEPTGPRPWSSQGPDEGSMFPPDLDALVEDLGPFTATPESCWFCLWEGYGWDHGGGISVYAKEGEPAVSERIAPAVAQEALDGPRVELPHRSYHLFRGPLGDIHQVPSGGIWEEQSPNLWWPTDRAWIVVTELDFPWTYVGGSAALIERIVADARLESMRVDPFSPLATVGWLEDLATRAATEVMERGTCVVESTAGVVEATFKRATRLGRGTLIVRSLGEHASGGGEWPNLRNRDDEALRAEISHYLYAAITQLS
jgi:hypothetical protein